MHGKDDQLCSINIMNFNGTLLECGLILISDTEISKVLGSKIIHFLRYLSVNHAGNRINVPLYSIFTIVVDKIV